MTPIIVITMDSIQASGVFSGLKQTIDETGIKNERRLFCPGEITEAQAFGFSEAQMNLINAMWTAEIIQVYKNSIVT